MQKKPGLPPNKVFSGNKRGRGRGRGGGPAGQFGGTMAPVHSLSKVQGLQFISSFLSNSIKSTVYVLQRDFSGHFTV